MVHASKDAIHDRFDVDSERGARRDFAAIQTELVLFQSGHGRLGRGERGGIREILHVVLARIRSGMYRNIAAVVYHMLSKDTGHASEADASIRPAASGFRNQESNGSIVGSTSGTATDGRKEPFTH